MNLQEKLFEASARLRARTVDRFARINVSLEVLNGARRELGKVARRHATRFVKQNSSIASAVGQDVARLARSTYVSLASRSNPPKARRPARARRRATQAA